MIISTKGHMSRMTIDVPEEDHKRLKALAAVLGRSMPEIIRPLSKLALFDKISNFYADFLKNFESMYVYMVEKFCGKDAKNGNFSDQMEFRKRSIIEWIHEHLYSSNTPNAETLEAIKQIEQGQNLIESDNISDLFKKLGI